MPITRRVARQVGCCGLALLLLGCSLCRVASGQSKADEETTTLSVAEARILVYVSPVGERQRASGLDIAMEEQSSIQLNQADYYYFWVYNAKRKQSGGSVTIGYYAVNRHTGDVWDTDEKKQLSSNLMSGVQTIVRESHHIDEGTMEKYRNKPF